MADQMQWNYNTSNIADLHDTTLDSYRLCLAHLQLRLAVARASIASAYLRREISWLCYASRGTDFHSQLHRMQGQRRVVVFWTERLMAYGLLTNNEDAVRLDTMIGSCEARVQCQDLAHGLLDPVI